MSRARTCRLSQHSTPETAAGFKIGIHGHDVWWRTLEDGITIYGLIEGRYGNGRWMARLQSQELVAA